MIERDHTSWWAEYLNYHVRDQTRKSRTVKLTHQVEWWALWCLDTAVQHFLIYLFQPRHGCDGCDDSWRDFVWPLSLLLQTDHRVQSVVPAGLAGDALHVFLTGLAVWASSVSSYLRQFVLLSQFFPWIWDCLDSRCSSHEGSPCFSFGSNMEMLSASRFDRENHGRARLRTHREEYQGMSAESRFVNFCCRTWFSSS